MSASINGRPLPALISGTFLNRAVELWLAECDATISSELQDAYLQLMSSSERARLTRFYFAHDRRRYLITRGLVRTVLSRYIDLSPDAWVFGANAYGRPTIENAEARAAGLSFNLSHTNDLIVLGIANNRGLGVDVENISVRKAALDVAAKYFAPDEAADLSALPPCQRQLRFFEYWTFKEAYVKAVGAGLCIPLDQFSFSYPNQDCVKLSISSDLKDIPSRWQFWQLRPTRNHVLAVCAEKVNGHGGYLTARRVTPLVSDEVVELPVHRASI